MKIYHNENTRQLIVTTAKFALSVYLQSDEAPEKKALELLEIYDKAPASLSTCPPIEHTTPAKLLPNEEGPQPELPPNPIDPDDPTANYL